MVFPSTLLKRGFTPNLKDLNNFLVFLSRGERFKTIINVFPQLSSNNLNADSHSHTIFAKALVKVFKYEEAAEFLKNHSGKSKVFDKNRIFDSLIQGFCTFKKDPEGALSLMKDLLKIYEVVPSSCTFCLLISSLSSVGKMERVFELLELISDKNLTRRFDNYICSSVISGFVGIGEPEFAVRFYESAVESGILKPNTLTCTALVTAFCKLRNVDKISDLVAWMEINKLGLDVVFYSIWLRGCFKEGLIDEAFRKVREMEDKKVELDVVSYTILVDGFSKEGNVEKAVGFLYRMKRNGVQPNLLTYTTIILGFCNKGKLHEAFAIFAMLKTLGIDADEFTYAILIHGVCKKGDFDLVFQLLDEMEKNGIQPGVVTLNTVINGLCKVGRTSQADDFSQGRTADAITYSTLLHGYIKEKSALGILETKGRMEAASIRMDVIMCNTLLKSLLMVGLFEDAFAIYKGLPQMKISPNTMTYYTLIDGYCKVGRMDEALEIFGEISNASDISAACYSCIISGLCKKGLLEMAINVFNEYITQSHPLDGTVHMRICYNPILRALLFEGKTSWARCILAFFIKAFGICEVGVSDILLHYLCLINVRTALVYLSSVNWRTSSLAIPVTVFETLINDGRVLDAYELFVRAENFLPDMNVFKYTIMIDALCKGMHIHKALDVSWVAKKKGISLNIVTYNAIINGLCHQGCLVEAFRLFDSLEKNDVLPSVITYGTLIDALVEERLLQDARGLFNMMFLKSITPNTHIYNSLINGYCKSSQLEEALKLFSDLEKSDLEPDEFSVAALIIGYCQKGEMEGALTLFFEFKSKGLLPDFLGFVHLIKGLCSKGRMEESRSILRYMLQTKSIIDLLYSVDTGAELDSVGNLLVVLCERGSIHEAVAVLDHVVSILISSETNHSYVRSNVDKLGNMLNSFDSEDGETPQLNNFDSLWTRVHSLCVKGNLAEANRLSKLIMDS